jgi:rod shape determining protein RodA
VNVSASTKFRYDPWLLFSIFALLATGLIALYSEGYGKHQNNYFQKQLVSIAIGTIPFLIFFKTDSSVWRHLKKPLYFINVFLLILVFVPGLSGGGNANRWVGFGPIQFQPSEAGKILTVLTLCSFYADRIDQVKSFSTFAKSFLHIFIPLILVFKQPHLGATLVILSSWLVISLYAGVPGKYLLTTVLVSLVLFCGALFIPGVLKPYQKERIRALFIKEEQGNNYQQINATIAFGVGGISGTGFLNGQQKIGKFIPEQRNDFIFTVVGEEFGLVGSTLVLGFFGLFFYRSWLILTKISEPFSQMALSGIITILGFHTIVNLGMNLHIAPVVGLWLPFISYGGTAIWLCFACVGLILQIYGNEKGTLF